LQQLAGLSNLESKQLSDDYLESLLDRFSKDENWSAYEQAQNEELIRVYELPCKVGRLDATNVPCYKRVDELFKHGYTKQRRSDLTQIKVMLVSLDPLSMPLCSLVASGSDGDDPHYVPAIEQGQKSLPKEGMLYIGDSKMSKKSTRIFIAKSNNFYITPLSQKQYSKSVFNKMILELNQETDKYIGVKDDKEQLIARVYEMEPTIQSEIGTKFKFKERRIMVQSLALASKQINKFQNLINKTVEQIEERFEFRQGRKIFSTIEEAQDFVQKILAKYKVADFLDFELYQSKTKYKKIYPIKCKLNKKKQAIENYESCCGYRLYATNMSEEKFLAQEVVPYYRQQYRIEQNFHQLLNKITHLLPVYLKKTNRIIGLVRLLVLALKFVTISQQQVRKKLKKTKSYLQGLVPGNAGKKVYTPTYSLCLKIFRNINIVQLIKEKKSNFMAEPLKQSQLKILELLDIPTTVYNQLSGTANCNRRS